MKAVAKAWEYGLIVALVGAAAMAVVVGLASADTHPQGGDVKQAPLVSGAVGDSRDAQPPSGDSHA